MKNKVSIKIFEDSAYLQKVSHLDNLEYVFSPISETNTRRVNSKKSSLEVGTFLLMFRYIISFYIFTLKTINFKLLGYIHKKSSLIFSRLAEKIFYGFFGLRMITFNFNFQFFQLMVKCTNKLVL